MTQTGTTTVPIMTWLFERGDRWARLVTRFHPGGGGYVLVMEWSNGLTTTERFSDVATFQTRILALEQQLATEGWKASPDSPQPTSDD
jgi:hypothetical protein